MRAHGERAPRRRGTCSSRVGNYRRHTRNALSCCKVSNHMGETKNKAVSADEARRGAEEARESEGKAPSFLKQTFLGNFRLDLVHPFPAAPPERPEFRAFMEKLERYLVEEVDSDAIDRDGKIPPRVVQGLAALGAFGMKIPKEYGGLGLTQREYGEAMKRITSRDGNLVVLLSAHQSIGVPRSG